MTQSRRARLWIAATVGISVSSGILLILQASLLAHIISRVYIHHATLDSAFVPLLWLLAIMLFRAGLSWLREITSFRASAQVRCTIRHELMQHLMRLGPVHCSQFNSGAISSTAIEHIEALQGFFADYLPQMILAVVIPLAILAVIFPLNWLAGIILLITAPLIPLFMALIGMGTESANQRHFQSLARLGAHFLDTLQGLTTLKYFNRCRAQIDAISTAANEYRQKTMDVLRIAFMSSAVLELFSSLAIAILAVYLGLGLLGYFHAGSYGRPFTLAHALFILLLAPEFFLPLRQLGTHYHARTAAIGAAKEILKIFEQTAVKPSQNKKTLHATQKIAIQFDKVSFAYQTQKTLFKELSFSIAPNEHVAIIGPSGSGKTTLLNVMAGFIQPQSGQLLINGVALTQLDTDHWRQHISWVGQNPRLFPGTLRDNIRLANPQASDAAVEVAARHALVWDFAHELPHGLDSIIGENNFGLSIGQAQRVALARAYLKNAPLLLLDEPTASLDQHSERRVTAALQQLAADKTLIIVSHRSNTIAIADRQFVLSNGQLIEQTTTTVGACHA